MYVGSDLAHLEVLRVSHATDQFLQFLAEQNEFLILLQVRRQRLAIWVCFKLVDQFLDCLSANIVFLLNG